MKKLNELIESAIASRACIQHIERLKQYNTIEYALEDEAAPYWCYWYAKHVIKGRWPEMEYKIFEESEWAYWYVSEIINGRCPEAESIISQSYMYSYLYALYVVKGRWPEGENAIMHNRDYWIKYNKKFGDGFW